MPAIKKHFNRKNFSFISKYVLISVSGYILVFSGLYLLVDILNFNKQVAFILVYGFVYLFLYSVQLKYLFKKTHNYKKLAKYAFSILSFYLLANILFYVGLKFKLNYLLVTMFTVLILMPFRVVVYKYFVYRD